MSPRRVRAALVAVLLVLALPLTAAAAPPTVRVEAPAGTILGTQPVASGSANAYVDSDGTAHGLGGHTALGQLLAASGVAGLDVAVKQYSFGAAVTGVGRAIAPAAGGWQYTVNDVPPSEGADVHTLHQGDAVVWWLVSDFAKEADVTPLDLRVVHASRDSVTLRVVHYSTTARAVTAAKGARVRVNGRTVVAGPTGRVVVRVGRHAVFKARATAPGAIRSQLIVGTT